MEIDYASSFLSYLACIDAILQGNGWDRTDFSQIINKKEELAQETHHTKLLYVLCAGFHLFDFN